MFQRDNPLHTPRRSDCIAPQDVLFQASIEQRDAAADRGFTALSFGALPFGESAVGFARRTFDIAGSGLFGDAGENGIDDIAKVAAAFALADDDDSGLDRGRN